MPRTKKSLPEMYRRRRSTVRSAFFKSRCGRLFRNLTLPQVRRSTMSSSRQRRPQMMRAFIHLWPQFSYTNLNRRRTILINAALVRRGRYNSMSRGWWLIVLLTPAAMATAMSCISSTNGRRPVMAGRNGFRRLTTTMKRKTGRTPRRALLTGTNCTSPGPFFGPVL
jgi:hypothetical protein